MPKAVYMVVVAFSAIALSACTASRPVGDKPWHIDLAIRTSHTKLASTKQQLNRRLDLPLKTDWLNMWHRPRTPMDRKTNLWLNALSLGIGRQETDWLTWTWYFVGGAGKDDDHQRILATNFEVHFKYASCYTGLKAEIYPWGGPAYRNKLTWKERLRASRPYLYTGFETGYVSGEGRGHYAVATRTLYADKVTVRDWLFGTLAGVGWRIPLNERWSISISGDYTYHFYRPDEYNSWNLITGLRYRF